MAAQEQVIRVCCQRQDWICSGSMSTPPVQSKMSPRDATTWEGVLNESDGCGEG